MALLCNNTNGSSAPSYQRTSLTSSPNLRAAHTIVCRVRFTSTATTADRYGAIWFRNASIDGSYIGRFAGDPAGQFNAMRANSTGGTVNTAVTTGYADTTTTRHFALTYDATNIRSYIDGVLQNTTASATTLVTSSTATSILVAVGQHVTTDVMLFARALDASEILSLSEGRMPKVGRGIADLVGWWPLFADDFVRDFSGNANNLSLVAGTGTVPSASNEDPGVPWSTRQVQIFLPPAAVNFGTASGDAATAGSGTLSLAGPLTGAGATLTAGSATLTRVGVLAGSGQSSAAGSATLTLTAALQGAGASATAGSGALTATIPLVGSGAAATAGLATLAAAIPLAGSGATQTTGSATLTGSIPLVGAGATTTAGSGTLTLTAALQGLGATLSAGLATLTATIPLTGAGATLTSGQATLAGSIPLVGSGATNTAGSATLGSAALAAFVGSGDAVTVGQGSLSAVIPLSGAGAALTAGSGTLGASIPLVGAGATLTSGLATLAAAAAMVGSGATGSAGLGTLTLTAALTGRGDTVTTGVATLTGGTPVSQTNGRGYGSRRGVTSAGLRRRIRV